MSVLWSAFDKLWKITEISDKKNHAKQTEPGGVARVCDIPYAQDDLRLHKLDVYWSENHQGGLPVVIDIHGGGWMYGDKELNKFYNLEIAARGYTLFNVSYRLVPEVTVREQLQDVMQALKWIGEHIGDYPWDGRNIMLTGDSAGGMLAAYAACLLSSQELRDIFGTVSPDIRLSCLILTSPVAYMDASGPVGIYTRMMWGDYASKPYAGYLDLDSLLPKAGLPPTLMITSDGDFIAKSQTVRAACDFRRFHIPCKLVVYPKFEGRSLPHVFAVLKPRSGAGQSCLKLMSSFYARYIK